MFDRSDLGGPLPFFGIGSAGWTSRIDRLVDFGTMPCSSLYSAGPRGAARRARQGGSSRSPCRRRAAPCREGFARPRPNLWISERSLRRKPSCPVEDADERDSGISRPFASRFDCDEHVELAAPQIANDLDALEVSTSEWR